MKTKTTEQVTGWADNYDHAVLNRVVFTADQIARIESERPLNSTPIPTTNGLELAAYREPNGSTFVTLIDGSEETWEAYCKEIAQVSKYRNGNAHHRKL